MKKIRTKKNATVIAAFFIQLCLGVLYAWPVFTKPLIDIGYSELQTQAIFAASFIFLPPMIIVAGLFLPVLSHKKLIMLSGFLLGAAYFFAGLLGSHHFWSMFFLIGVVSGAAIGLGYSIPISVGMKWFPHKKGLITGIAVSGFGMGALVWVKLADDWGNLIERFGVDETLMFFGVLFFAILFLASFYMVPPQQHEVQENDHLSSRYSFKSKEMLKTMQYYVILCSFIFSTCAGLMLIGLMKIFPILALENNNIAQASAIASTAMAIFFAPANGIGRILWGRVADKIGCKKSLIFLLGIQGVLILLFPFLVGNPLLLYLLSALIGLNFGGNFTLFPTITAEFFGTRYFEQNNGWVIIGWGVGGIIGPIVGGILGDKGQFYVAYTIGGLLCLLACLSISFIKAPRETR